MLKTNRLTRGFTIVELLVVIVVIAILASVTIVAYTGIQKQAVTVAYVSAVDAMEKQIRIALARGAFDSIDTGGLFVCAGMQSDFPAGDGLASGQCSTTGNYLTQPNTPVYANDTISTALKDAGVQLPGELASANRPGIGGDGISARGIVFFADSTRIALFWYPPDASSCGRASNETEALIALYKSSPGLTSAAVSAYGADWENVIRNGLGGWCSLKIDR